jgi:HlyD family secretion protein
MAGLNGSDLKDTGVGKMRPRSWYSRKYVLLPGLAAALILVFGTYRVITVKADKQSYLFGSVDRGSIILQVAATGTLQAVTTVQVGTQVSGTIAELYADFNSEVKKGQLLAKLDPALFEAQVQQAEANVTTAEATVNDTAASIASMKANLDKAKVDVLDKQRKMKRQQELWDAKLIARDDLDTAEAAIGAAVATQRAAEAELESAQARYKADQARLLQAQAALETAKVNLQHTIITSPISGTIISRSVDRGQTVAASFSSPTLFTIAADLTKMQVNTNVDEADVGRILAGMEATFTVDSYPNETFRGKISQVRLAASTIQNVVTYNAIIDVDNPQLKLKPGMTANVKVLIQKADNVLRLPSAALRFRPNLSDSDLAQAYQRAGEEKYLAFVKSRGERSGSGGGMAGRPGAGAGFGGPGMGLASAGATGSARGGSSAATVPANRGRRAPVWVIGPDKLLRPVVVRLGLTDGVTTQIEEGKLKEGDHVIVALEAQSNSATPATTRAPGFGGPTGGPRRF